MRGRAWLVAGLVALAVPALIDIATGDDAFARSLYLLPVLAIATRARAGRGRGHRRARDQRSRC